MANRPDIAAFVASIQKAAQEAVEMSEKTDDTHEKARDLAETALGEYAKGHDQQGDKLAEQAVKLDRSAVEELVEDLDEDAATTGHDDKDAA